MINQPNDSKKTGTQEFYRTDPWLLLSQLRLAINSKSLISFDV